MLVNYSTSTQGPELVTAAQINDILTIILKICFCGVTTLSSLSITIFSCF